MWQAIGLLLIGFTLGVIFMDILSIRELDRLRDEINRQLRDK